MSYIYLFDIYKYIDQELSEIEETLKDKSDGSQDCYLKGKKDIFQEFKSHLQNTLNQKLPRSVAKKLKNEI